MIEDFIYYNTHWAAAPRDRKVDIVKHNKIFYVHMSLLGKFFNNYAPKETEPFGLVSEGGDLCIHKIQDDIVIGNTFLSTVTDVIDNNLLYCKNMKYWLSSNNNTNIPIISFPLGISRIINTIDNIDKNKKNRILMCFNVENYRKLRTELITKFSSNNNVDFFEFPMNHNINQFNTDKPTENHTYLLSLINKYKYVMCPESNGLDTNRIWECSLFNTIQIMNDNPFSKNIQNITNNIICNLLKLDTNKIVNGNPKLIEVKKYATNTFWLEFISNLESSLE